jgi:dihydroneopterin aldolase
MNTQAFIELRDLLLETQIGTYGPNDTRPDVHLLDLTLGIDTSKVLISTDEMRQVFDYDPLIAKSIVSLEMSTMKRKNDS